MTEAAEPAPASPLTPRTALVLFLTCAAGLVAGGLVVTALGLGLWSLAPVQLATLLLPPLAWASRAGVLREAFPLKPLGARAGAASLLLVAGGSALALGTAVAIAAWLGESASERALREMLLEVPFPARFALFAAVPALCEEALFRGAILACLRPWGRVPACLASAALFAVLHLDPLKMVPVGLLGFVFAWAAWETGSLWPALVGHCLHNGLVLALVERGDGTLAEPQVALAGAAFLAVSGCALAALALRLFPERTP